MRSLRQILGGRIDGRFGIKRGVRRFQRGMGIRDRKDCRERLRVSHKMQKGVIRQKSSDKLVTMDPSREARASPIAL